MKPLLPSEPYSGLLSTVVNDITQFLRVDIVLHSVDPQDLSIYLIISIMKLKRISLAVAAAALSLGVSAQQAKYIFYFIGDGMGPNQIAVTEYYLGELADSVGISPIGFTQWPVASLATNYSTSSRVTDSAASGTALATGHKTDNGCIGVASDKVTPLKSIAYLAKEAGKRVGVASSVGVNHATPASFFGHNAKRSSYHDLAMEMPESGFEFFAGADFCCDAPADTAGVFDNAVKKGYTIARGADEYRAKSKGATKMIMLQPSEATATVGSTLPYAIDRKDGDMTLREITEAGIDFLTRDGAADENGFFLMVEGGNIDWQSHGNDAAAVVREVADFDNAIQAAYDFYLAHPDETLIVVTADHETGSLNLGTGHYALNLKALANQKVSEDEMSRIFNSIRRANDGEISWEMAQKALAENFGFWTEAVSLSEKQEARLRKAFEKSFGSESKMEKSEYKSNYPLSAEAKRITNEIAQVGWGSGAHSATYIPVFAIGAGAETFSSRSDNALIPRRIAAAGGFPIND